MLIAWLGATYLHKVPTERYRQQGRSSSPVTSKTVDTAAEIVAGNEPTNR